MVHTHHQVPEFLLVIIIIGYLVIAGQFFRGLSIVRPEARRARLGIFALVSIFILCSGSGYVPSLVRVPDWLHTTTHFVLAVATWAFIGTREASRISAALK